MELMNGIVSGKYYWFYKEENSIDEAVFKGSSFALFTNYQLRILTAVFFIPFLIMILQKFINFAVKN
jgi:hypothetical protein